MKPSFEAFNQFLINNYYSPFTYDEYTARLEQYFDDHEEVAQEFGAVMGENIASNLVELAGLEEEDLYKLELIEDHLPLAYEASLGIAHFEYLISFFANEVTKPVVQQPEE